jgi:TolB-like protein/DNA-binding winged helix-turn-helix (wHTH) protein
MLERYMSVLQAEDIVEFEGFRLDRRTGSLSRVQENGQITQLPIGSRAVDILRLLIDHQGDLVSKQTILERVWPATIVEESNLTIQISALRRVLDQDRQGKSCIQTIPGRGYRFLPVVSRVSPTLQLDLPGTVVAPSAPFANVRTSKLRQPATIFGLCAALLIACLALFFGRQATAPSSTPPRLSLAVLPLQNIGEDKNDDYLANGITEDLRSDLSHIPGSSVVALTAAGPYRASGVTPNHIGRDLNVRYLIQGTIRRVGAIIRVNVQLVATENATTLWADRFDEDIATLAAGQDRIVGRLRAGLGISLVDVESIRSQRERPTSPDAFDLVLQARALLNQPPSEERSGLALALYERALTLDPDSIHVLTGIALVHINKAMDQGRWADPEALQRADDLLTRARRIAPNSERVLVANAAMLRSQDRCDDLTEAAEKLIKLFPNSITGYNFLGWCKLAAGHAEEELPLLQKVMQIEPVGPNISVWYQRIAQDYNLRKRSARSISHWPPILIYSSASAAMPIASSRFPMRAWAIWTRHAIGSRKATRSAPTTRCDGTTSMASPTSYSRPRCAPSARRCWPPDYATTPTKTPTLASRQSLTCIRNLKVPPRLRSLARKRSAPLTSSVCSLTRNFSCSTPATTRPAKPSRPRSNCVTPVLPAA